VLLKRGIQVAELLRFSSTAGGGIFGIEIEHKEFGIFRAQAEMLTAGGCEFKVRDDFLLPQFNRCEFLRFQYALKNLWNASEKFYFLHGVRNRSERLVGGGGRSTVTGAYT
jgi:hypothetical protein